MSRARSSRNEVFISHSSRDHIFVQHLVGVLKDHGILYWYSPAHISGAKKWHDEIGRALNRCNWFLIVLTPDSVRSQWVKRELLFALNQTRYNDKIIPILRKSCKYSSLSWTLSESQFVEFRRSFKAGCRKLLAIWRLKYQPTGKIRHKTKKK